MVNFNRPYLLYAVLIILILITLFTKFEGGADTYDYTDASKFFAGKYDAKMRSSHSYLYGLIHTPFVWLFESFFIFKITSLIFLFLLIYSVYLMSGKDKRALWLMVLSPIVWYSAPMLGPITLSSLLFLWGWHFIKKYNINGIKKGILNLFYSGLLVGLSWAFWDGILFFIPLFAISFLYDRKLLHSIYFVVFLIVGTLPRLILDQILFGFPFFGIIRHVMASLALTFIGGFYGQESLFGVGNLILVIIFFPIYTYLLYKKEIFSENRKTAIFVLLSFFLLIVNSQIRFVLLIVPIILVSTNKYMTNKKFIIQIAVSLILILLVVNPYVLQTKWSIGDNEKGIEFGTFVRNIENIELRESFITEELERDINAISSEYPNQTFVVGNSPDDYRILANLYWGDNVREFVSIEDYRLNLAGDPVIAIKEICSKVKINDRRDLCASVWIRKAFGDETDYDSIIYGVSFSDNLSIEGFNLIKKYERLSLFEKSLNIGG